MKNLWKQTPHILFLHQACTNVVGGYAGTAEESFLCAVCLSMTWNFGGPSDGKDIYTARTCLICEHFQAVRSITLLGEKWVPYIILVLACRSFCKGPKSEWSFDIIVVPRKSSLQSFSLYRACTNFRPFYAICVIGWDFYCSCSDW